MVAKRIPRHKPLLIGFIVGGVVLGGIACHRDCRTVESAYRISEADAKQIQPWLQRTGVVFVGTLNRFDRGVMGVSGLGVASLDISFHVVRALRGSPGAKDVKVTVVFLGADRWVEPAGDGMLQLSPRFFHIGCPYVVAAERGSAAFNSAGGFVVFDPIEIWPASAGNVKRFEMELKPE
jgi:hypothetical protein